jgi:hypothetical protein
LIELFNFNHFCYSFNPFIQLGHNKATPASSDVCSTVAKNGLSVATPKGINENKTGIKASLTGFHCNADADFRRQGPPL